MNEQEPGKTVGDVPQVAGAEGVQQPGNPAGDPPVVDTQSQPGNTGAPGGKTEGTNPAQAMLRHFDYSDLPDGSTERQVLAVIGTAAAEVAAILANQSGPEQTAGMRKLLEASDCFRRAAR